VSFIGYADRTSLNIANISKSLIYLYKKLSVNWLSSFTERHKNKNITYKQVILRNYTMLKIKNSVYTGLATIALSTIASSVLAATGNAPIEVTSNKSLVSTLAPVFAAEDRYIVTFTENETSAQDQFGTSVNSSLFVEGKLAKDNVFNLLESTGAKPHLAIEELGMVAVTMTAKQASLISTNANVSSVEKDHRRYLMAQTTTYGIPMVQADQLAQNNLSAKRVCVIDTGFNLGHPDLGDQNNGVTGNSNNNAVGNWFNDGNGHGTHVAGTIAALNNDRGVVGVYPGVDLHVVKIFDDNGQWTFSSNLINGIQQCANAGSDVVNMSLGGGSASNTERNAVQDFVDDGILLVAAAGNAGNSSLSYPASYDAVMSVAAVDSSENRASYSQYNSQVEIAAPGSDVWSTWPTNTYNQISGTSMATPHVAGAAALVWSFFPSCSNEQIRSALNATAKDKGASGRDNFYGNGIVQVRDAYEYINTRGCDGQGGGSGGGAGVEPFSGQLTNLSGSRNTWKRYTWDVPAGVSKVTIRLSGGTGDADLYMKLGSQPETNSYDCRPYQSGNNEVCVFEPASSGIWHVGIRAYSTFRGVTMDYSYE
jgi:serine protease